MTCHILGTKFEADERKVYCEWAATNGANASPALRHIYNAMANGVNIEMSKASAERAFLCIEGIAGESDNPAPDVLRKLCKALGNELP